jgi:hypothetical protein
MHHYYVPVVQILAIVAGQYLALCVSCLFLFTTPGNRWDPSISGSSSTTTRWVQGLMLLWMESMLAGIDPSEGLPVCDI